MIKPQSQTSVSGFALLPPKGSGIHCNPGYAGQESGVERLWKRSWGFIYFEEFYLILTVNKVKKIYPLSTETLSHRLTKRTNLIILVCATIIYFTLLVFQISSIRSKTYLITQEDVQEIDSVIVRTRANHNEGGGKSAAMIQFDDTRGNNIQLSGASYLATKQLDKLYDTLRNYGTSLSVYVLKEDVGEYYDDNFDRIDIYGLKLGSQTYLTLQNINEEKYNGRYTFLIFGSICYFIFLVIHIAQVKKNINES